MRRCSIRRAWVCALTVAVLATSGCAVTRGAWRETKHAARVLLTKQGRTERLARRAATARDAGEFERAEQLYEKLRERWPSRAETARSHAVVLARLGRHPEAWSALDDAVRLGLHRRSAVEFEPAFAGYRGDPRFTDLLDRMRRNREAFQEAWNAPLDVARRAAGPAFASRLELDRAFEREERALATRRRALSPDEYAVEERTLHAKKIAALARFARTRPTPAEREIASLDLVREWLEFAGPLARFWEREIAAELAAAADRFLEEFPASPHSSEVRLYRTVADLNGTIDAGYDWEADAAPPPDCGRSLEELEAHAADATDDKWAGEALGFLALCLYEAAPADSDRVREAYTAYFDLPHVEREDTTPFGFRLHADLRILRIKVEGLPEFRATTLDGDEVSPAKLRGRTVLLDFWAPG